MRIYDLLSGDEIDNFEETLRIHYSEILRALVPEYLHPLIKIEHSYYRYFSTMVTNIVNYKFDASSEGYTKSITFAILGEVFCYSFSMENGVISDISFVKV